MTCQNCTSGQVCVDTGISPNQGECVDRCYSDDECPEGEVCQGCICQPPALPGSICQDVDKGDIDFFTTVCRIDDFVCDLSKWYAFDSLDLRAYGDAPGGLAQTNPPSFAIGVNNSNIFCCQDDKDCDDGYTGCCTDNNVPCTCSAECCNVDDCISSQSIYHTDNYWFCSGQNPDGTTDTVCTQLILAIPNKYESGDLYRVVRWADIDFLNNAYTCDELKALRTNGYTNANSYCQRESGKVDDDFPCLFRFACINCSSGDCADECRA